MIEEDVFDFFDVDVIAFGDYNDILGLLLGNERSGCEAPGLARIEVGREEFVSEEWPDAWKDSGGG